LELISRRTHGRLKKKRMKRRKKKKIFDDRTSVGLEK